MSHQISKNSVVDYHVQTGGFSSVLDDIVKLAALICDVPIALLTVRAGTRLLIQAKIGIEMDQIPLKGSFCERAFSDVGLVVIEDLKKDVVFSTHPFVVGEPKVQFYAGITFGNDKSSAIGTLCILDFKQNKLTEKQKFGLESLSRQAFSALELRRLSPATIAFKNVFNNLGVSICKVDARDGRILLANKSYCEMLGYPEDELKRMTVHDLTHPDDRSGNQTNLGKKFETLAPSFSYDKRYLKKNGDSLWVRVKADLVREESDAYVGVIYDLSEEKRAVNAFQKSETQLRQLADSLPILLWVAREDGHIDYRNRLVRNAEGSVENPPAASVDAVFKSLVHADDYYSLRSSWHRAQATHGAMELEVRLKDNSGNYRWHLVRATPTPSEKGSADRWFFTATEIESFKRTFDLVKEREEELDLATSSGSVGIWGWDLVTGELRLSSLERELLGIPIDKFSVNFDDFEKVVYEPDLEPLKETLRSVVSGEREFNSEFRIVKNGEIRWLSGKGKVIRDRLGKPLRMVGANTDVTEFRREAYEKEQLKIREQSAMAASQLKTDFLANMSHEIRTPINGIIGMTNLLLDESLTGEQARFANSIKSSSAILLTLINDILDISKIESGKMDLEIVPFKLSHLLEDLKTSYLPLMQAKSISFAYNIAPETAEIYSGDPGRIRQILNNLVGNALKFTERGSIQIQISEILRTEKVRKLQFSIADSGIGMSASAIPKLFQTFSQADASTARKYGGSGLGLSICKKLVEMMSGSIEVRSIVGVGTTFEFVIDLPSTQASLKPVSRVETKELLNAGQRQNFNVLVAEDNAVNTEITLRMLAKAGYRAQGVGNGLEVIATIKQFHFDLILMDCQMPEMDGYEASRELRKQGSKIPIIALTANAFKADRDRCLESGMDGYVTKPIHSTELISAIDHCFSGDSSVVEVQNSNLAESDTTMQGSLDVSALERLKFLDEDGSEKLIEKLVEIYFRTASKSVEEIVSALNEGKPTAQKLAHALKSSSANLGLIRIVAILDEIELRTKPLSELQTSALRLREELLVASETLKVFTESTNKVALN